MQIPLYAGLAIEINFPGELIQPPSAPGKPIPPSLHYYNMSSES